MNKKSFLIYGAGGQGKVTIEILKEQYPEVSIFVVDDNSEINNCLDYSVSLPDKNFFSNKICILCIGDNAIRKKIFNRYSNLVQFSNYISHYTSYISPSAQLGMGTVILPKGVIHSNANIGNHCIINTGSIIEHDATIGDFVHMAPGSVIGGDVKVGNGTLIGLNATVLPGLTIGKNAIVGAGTIVTKDVPDKATVIGCPAKPIN